jgi:hypothetical protein
MKMAVHIRAPFGWHHPRRENARRLHSGPSRFSELIVGLLVVATLGLTAASAYLLWAKVSSLWPFL